MITKPNKFESAEQFIELWQNYCNEIIENGFKEAPTQTAFCKWLADNYQETDRRTIYNTLNKIFPDIKKDFERIRSDTVMMGGMLGKYQPTMSIFGLKNWCGWKDTGDTNLSVKTAEDDGLSKALKEIAEKL